MEGELERLRRRVRELEEACRQAREAQRRAEFALAEHEQLWRALMESDLTAASLIDEDGTILCLNARAAAMLGGRPDDLVGKNIRSLLPDQAVEEYIAGLRQIITSGQSRSSLRWVELASGRRCLHSSVEPVTDPDSQRRVALVISADVTELQNVQEAIRRQERAERGFMDRLKVLHEVVNELSLAESFDELCRRAVELGRDRLGFERVGLWFCTEDPQIMVGSFGIDEHGRIRDERGYRNRVLKEWLSRIVSREELGAIVERNLTLDEGTKVRRGAMRAVAGLWDGHRVLGFLCVDNLFSGRPLDRYQCELLALYASALGHLCTRRRAQDALASSEATARALLDASMDRALLYDTRGVILALNEQAARSLGGSVSELVGRCAFDLFGPEVAARRWKQFCQVVRTGQALRVQDQRGGRWLDTHVYPVRDSHGKVTQVAIYARDVTVERRATEALRQREKAERAFLEKLRALHGVVNELSTVESFDELCRRAVELGRGKLGFERLGLWFLTGEPNVVRGSFGVDEHGRLQDERAECGPVDPNSLMGRMLREGSRLGVVEETDLLDGEGRIVGRGTIAIASLWDGERIIGCLCADNLLSGEPMSLNQRELLGLYASTLGHLCSRLRMLEALRASEA
ncbi:MAG: hypothetical protein B1H04_03820, partial [Planctomycetales bacterium 4484_123]